MSQGHDRRDPCIIGVAAQTWRGADAPEPLTMWQEVVRAASLDCGARVDPLTRLDGLDVVYCQTTQYDQPVDRLCDALGIAPKRRHYSGIGGTTPQQLVDANAERMLAGELDIAVVTSAEALATQRAIKRRGERPNYSFRPDVRLPFPYEAPFLPTEVAHEVFQAWLTFALFDNARRARLGVALDDYRHALGEMFAPMSRVAATNEHAWFPTARSVDDIVDPSPENRMVGYPYTKYMVAVMDVDMAAALVMATDAAADDLGVPQDQRVYLRGWGYRTDPVYVAEHPDLTRSPALAEAVGLALGAAGVGVDDVAHLDLYSCFGASLHFACDALGLDPCDSRGLTVTGGLPYHGGPASGYMTHSIVAMVERLRNDSGSFGLTTGVGMHNTKHVAGVWSGVRGATEPVPTPEQSEAPEALTIVEQVDGDANVAAYSVVHGRDGAPEWALLVCDVAPGVRAYARLDDPDRLEAAEREELVGTSVRLASEVYDGPAGQGIRNRAVG